MPKIARVLKKLEVDKIKKDGLHAVGGAPGLSLQITGNRNRKVYAGYPGV